MTWTNDRRLTQEIATLVMSLRLDSPHTKRGKYRHSPRELKAGHTWTSLYRQLKTSVVLSKNQ